MILKLLKKYSNFSDEDLVKKYQSSEDSYYAALLFERYNELTVSLSLSYLKNSMDAEDATMECFELLLKDLKKQPIQNFGGWYYSVVRNYLLKVKRAKAKHSGEDLIEGLHDQDFDGGINLDELFEKNAGKKQEEVIKEAFKELKPLQAQCIKHFYLEQKSYVEIAKLLNIEEKKVKSHIQNGKRKMKITLEKQNINSVDEIL